ncbi:hypothetical protein COW82_01730 [Candidatus Campbellbacteria bacterium CG22_combo_CG10-13_8_21_14_all_43_18]|uniref:Uncharacterized protein n=1 Tax=Candidatus Campbellbacteria bacterium CG22_combo_CG10-13_8_21_14_all_43_18 TaxID=1974530 RepID=A0A2H0DWY1_9BACT|nr:MAG: hypothetical protein COW82_01730 [Candidatus Campbellbacteria bacterium CG22_combo_CG10-13_8_21_14_all_43_18]
MPELPEVQITVDGINKYLPGRKILSVWTDYKSGYFKGKKNIKDPAYFKKFRKFVAGKKIKRSERKGKNIIVHFSGGGGILIHMKMTGHLLYGRYEKINPKLQISNYEQIQNSKAQKTEDAWLPTEEGPLRDPFNRHIRLVFELSDGKRLALSDMRRFAKVMYFETSKLSECFDGKNIAQDPFEINKKEFIESLRRKKTGRIKNILMDQTLVSGIGNIYSDETLFETGVHPETNIGDIPDKKLGEIYEGAKKILKKGIKFGGDSASDYRNIKGEPGAFQKKHKVYRRTGEKCPKKGCSGKIVRKVVGGRSAHFCNRHQKLKR